jgi:beta-lactamase class A
LTEAARAAPDRRVRHGWILASVLAAACSSDRAGRADAQPGGDATSMDGAPVIPCPQDLGDHWECGDGARLRCIDEVLQQEPCASGCVPASGASEAVCSCGGQDDLIRWNCLDDGDLHACRAGGWLTESCDGRGCEVRPPGTSDVCSVPSGHLQDVIDRLGDECATLSPGTSCGLAVRDLVTGEAASHRGTVPFEAASTVKAVWVALALYDVGPAPIEPYADPVFVDSDNVAAGRVIDLLSSPDRINTFMWHDARMPDSGFCRWNTDRVRESPLCETDLAGGANYLAADDAVRFLGAVWDRSLIGSASSQQLLDWMLLSPRAGYGGWIGTQLPAAARDSIHHKAGWYPPYTSHEIGIVEIPGGHPYAVALLLARSDGSDAAYDSTQLPMLEYASCVVYHAVADAAGDPFADCSPP